MSISCARCIAFVIAAAGCLLPVSASAQAVFPGARVRVVNTSTGAPSVTGDVVRVAGDSVFIRTGETLAEHPIHTVWFPGGPGRLEVRTAVHDHKALGSLIGATVGTAAGYAIASGIEDTCGASTYNPCVSPMAVGVFGGFFAGFFIGAVIGKAIKSEQWVPAAHLPVHLSLAPSSRGTLFSVSLSF